MKAPNFRTTIKQASHKSSITIEIASTEDQIDLTSFELMIFINLEEQRREKEKLTHKSRPHT